MRAILAGLMVLGMAGSVVAEGVQEAKRQYQKDLGVANERLAQAFKAQIDKQVKAGNLDEALRLREELKQVQAGESRLQFREKLHKTRWTWVKSSKIQFFRSGIVKGGISNRTGHWSAMGDRTVVIRWPNGFIDHLIFNEPLTRFEVRALNIPSKNKPSLTGLIVR